jgi:hypothetical protein
LRGPSSSNGTGRVEVFYNRRWGTICHYNWDINDANVVCRQLGYKNALRALSGYQVPDGTGQIWLNYVRCTGKEENLISCSHNGWGNTYCSHYQDAGVECSLTGKIFSSIVFNHSNEMWILKRATCILVRRSLLLFKTRVGVFTILSDIKREAQPSVLCLIKHENECFE